MTVNYFSAMPIYSVWSVAVSGMLMVEDQSCGCWKIMKTIREKIAQGSGPIVYLVFCICVTLAAAVAGLGINATVLPLVIFYWLILALFHLINFITSNPHICVVHYSESRFQCQWLSHQFTVSPCLL